MKRRIIAAAVGTTLVTGLISVLPATEARAAASFAVNSLAFANASDAKVGDGICATAAGECTLRAALQEANHAGNATVTIADGWAGGTIAATATTSDWMHVAALSPESTGAYYLVSGSNITLDLKGKLAISTVTDNAATAIYVSGANATVRNATNVFGGEDSFQVSGSGVTLSGLNLQQTSNYNTERAVVVRKGANNLTIENSVFSGNYGTGAAGEGVIQFDASANVTNVKIRDNSFLNDSSTTACSTTNGRGCRRTGISGPAGTTVNGLSITGNVFDGNSTELTPPIRFVHAGVKLSAVEISDNQFTHQSTAGVDGTYYGATISLPYLESLGGTNSIKDNTFTGVVSSGTPKTAFAIVWWGPVTAPNSVADSGLTISGNTINGYSRYGSASTSAIRLYQTGTVTVEKNVFGADTLAVTTSASETSINAGLFANYSNTSNRKVGTWYPSATSVPAGSACKVQVTVGGPNGSTAARYPARLDFYYSAGSGQGAEKLIGSTTVTSDPAGKTFDFPWNGKAAGTIRIQTQGNVGQATQQESSQYSRQAAVGKSICGPAVTVEQASTQQDPTYERLVHFVVSTSEALATSGSGALTASDFTVSASTAPNVTVTTVTRRSDTLYDVYAKASDSGDIVLSLPAGAVTDTEGNPASASTSKDNTVTYRNPLSLSPATLVVYQGQAGREVTIQRVASLAPTSKVTITPSLDNGWASASVATLTASGPAKAVSTVVSAADLGGQERSSRLTYRVTSDDPNFDGLVLPVVQVTAQHAELSITKLAWADPEHTVSLARSAMVEDGQLVYWTYTVVNLGDITLDGVSVTDDALPADDYPAGLVCSTQTLAPGARTVCDAVAPVHAN